MNDIAVQYAVPKKSPSVANLKRWATEALNAQKQKSIEMTLRIVAIPEMTKLNQTYRNKKGPTNVLAFPHEKIKSTERFLGDIVICADVVAAEAASQQKTYQAHFAHMVVHGTLHLLGFDHVIEKDAIKMEKKEIKILQQLGFSNPYKVVI